MSGNQRAEFHSLARAAPAWQTRVMLRFTLKTILLLSLAMVSELAAETGGKKRSDEKRSDPIVVGISSALTGAMSPGGIDVKNGIVFANDYLFHGRYRFVIEDDRCDPRTAISVAQKLVQVDKVKYVLGFPCNAALLAAAPVFQKAGTIVITSGATTGDKTGLGRNLFRLFPADQLAAGVLFDYMAKVHRHIGVLTEPDEYSELMQRTFEKRALETGGRVQVSVVQVSPETSDFKGALLKLKGKGVDGLFFNALSEPGYIEMVKQAKKLGITAKHYANLIPASKTAIDSLGALDEGTKFSATPSTDLTTKESKALFDAFVARFGEPNSMAIMSTLAIDSLRLLDAAIHSGDTPQRYLETVRFNGLSGPIGFDDDSAVNTLHYEIHEIRGGKPKKIS